MDNLVHSLFILFLIFIYTLYKYLTKNKDYWKSRGVPEAKGAVLVFGHMKDVILMKKNMGTFLEDIDKNHRNNSMVGIYEFRQPVLIVRDPNLIKIILQTGFSSFSEHPILDDNLDPLFSKDPFFENNQEWKESRGFFTNAFSVKKIKEQLPIIRDVSKKFINFIHTKVPENQSASLEMKVLFSKFTASVSASVILGIDAETFVDNDPPDSLRSMMDAIFYPKSLSIRQILVFFNPGLGKLFNIGFVPGWINTGFQQIVDSVISVRKRENKPRNDVLQQIIDYLRDKNKSDKLAAGHAFGFFVEVYETSSIALSTMSYYLARHPEIQDKARGEINEIIEKHGGLTYEGVNEMDYMDQIIREALRLISPAGRLIKNCTEPVVLEGSDGLVCKLKKGDQVVIPVYSLHKNPEHWDDPDEFRPERFGKDNFKELNRYTFLAFGLGPRMCPGIKFAFLQIKLVMADVLRNYVLEPSDKMQEPIKIDPKHFFTTIQGGYWVNLRHLDYCVNKN